MGLREASHRSAASWLCATTLLILFTSSPAAGHAPVHLLEPPDRSSPRAALRTFLESADRLARYLVEDYLPSPTRAEFALLSELARTTVESLDLSAVPPSARTKEGRAAALALYETLSRIELPSWDDIPGADAVGPMERGGIERWVIPHTEIALVRTRDANDIDEFLFSPRTVERAAAFHQVARDLPYARSVPYARLAETLIEGGGWPIRVSWIMSMPSWLRVPFDDNALWKWMALLMTLSAFLLLLRLVYLFSRYPSERPFIYALTRLALPLSIFVATPAISFVALVTINLNGNAAVVVGMVATAIMFLSGAWLAWRAAPVLAETIIASPNIPTEGVDAYLIRISMRLLGLAAGTALLSIGAGRLGVPVYGIVAGLGVGGLAVALAAQPTVENLIGSLSLFADKPVRVGDLCRYGSDIGMVEAIGIRSTRIRGLDRTLTTIPNAELSKMPIVNFAARDRMLIRTVIGVRYETNAEQLRFLLAKLREMLLSHPRIDSEAPRARFVAFGASSLDLEVNAYALTADWPEFLAIQEEVLLRIMDIIDESGTSVAFPSQTLYLAGDPGTSGEATAAVQAEVQRRRGEDRT